ncbi:hypothetical protein MMC13_001392 [Lambiella insularis]|nr:hypothetical protein [Lambiella insularis]
MRSIRFGSVQYTPRVVRTAEEAVSHGTSWDYLVICSKCMPENLPSTGELIRPAVGPKTTIVLIQNGINIETDIAAMYPDNPLLSCVVYLPTTQIEPGVIDYGFSQNETLNILEIGTFPASAPQWHKDAAQHFAALVQKGGGNAQVFHDIQPRKWGKVVVNAAWNPICALSLSSDADFLRSSPGAVHLVRKVMLEVVAIAKAAGIQGVDEALAEHQLKRNLARTVGKEPSMLTDVRENRPFEVEAIVGNAIRLAKHHKVEVPLLEAIYALAKGLYEAKTRSRQTQIIENTN